VAELMTDPSVRAEDMRRITVVGSNDLFRAQCEPAAERVAPARSIDAKWSLPFLMGKFLSRGTLRIGDFSPDGLRDEQAIEIAKRVEWRVDSTLRGVRDGFGPGIVELDMADGRKLQARADHAFGHPDRPLSWEQLTAKFDDCLEVAAVEVSTEDRDEVVAAVADLESAADVGLLVDRLSRGVVRQ
jgi:2-methylcitrate dehydratase PrpD